MQIKLIEIALENYCGIDGFRYHFNGRDADISGPNGCGKSTIMDAYMWLVCSHDQQKNRLKRDFSGAINEHNAAIARCVLTIDDKEKISLKKVYKKYGRGFTTDHFFDDAPVKKTEYDQILDEKIGPLQSRLMVSDIYYICATMPMADRRKVLLSMIDDDAPDYSLDKRKLAAEKRRLSDVLNALPIKIMALTDAMECLEPRNENALKAQIETLDGEIQGLKEEIIVARHNGLSSKKIELEKLKAESLALNNRAESEYKQAKSELMDKRIEFQTNVKKIADDIDMLAHKIEMNISMRKSLFADYRKISGMEFKADTTCESCGQTIPAGIAAAHKSIFNQNKADKLRYINEQGEQWAAEFAELENKMTSAKDLQALEKETITSIDAQLASLSMDQFGDHEKAMQLHRECNALAEEILTAENDFESAVAPLRERSMAKTEEKRRLESELAAIAAANATLYKIGLLRNEQKAAAAEFERVEKEIWEIEKDEKEIAEKIEAMISRKFDDLTWRLFEPQVNGGQKNICEAYIDGVPFNSGLNTGARISAGINAVKVLTDHFGLSMPVFIDNAEALIEFPQCEFQRIRLEVKDTEFRTIKMEEE